MQIGQAVMKDSEFHALVEERYQLIEEAIDNCDTDIDCELNSGVVTLTFENGTKIIINKQEPLHQIWVATRENGYHFDLKDNQWIDNRGGRELMELLSDACSKQSGESVTLG
jgi:CyaY protein